MYSYKEWTQREKTIARKYWQGKSYSEIGKVFNLTRARIGQIVTKIGLNSNINKKKESLKERLGEIKYYRFYSLPKSIKQKVFERDSRLCQYCKGSSGDKKLSIDHIMPKSLGGSHDMDNLITACLSCNVKKGKKTLIEWIRNEKVSISA